MDADEVFFARQLQLHRRACFLGEHCGDEVGILVLILVAEASAHVVADDVDFFRRYLEVARHVGAAVRDALRRRVDRQLVALPRGQRGARLHLRVMDEGGREPILEHVIRLGESGIDVAALLRNGHQLISRVGRQVALRPDLRRVRLERRFRIEHEGERLVVDVDQLQRVLGRVSIDGCDRRHRIADEPYGVVEGVTAVLGDLLDFVVVLLPAGNPAGAPHDLAVLVRDDGFDAGQRARLRRVDADDPRVRMRTAQHACVQHSRQPDVAGVLRFAGDALYRVDARCCVAHDIQRGDSLWREALDREARLA